MDSEETPAEPRPALIRHPNTLLRKVSRGRGLTPEQMAGAADVQVEALKADGLKSIRTDVLRLDALYRVWVPGDPDPAPALDALYQTAHDLRGLGGTFGCDLVTMVARSLCRLLERTPPGHPRLHAAVGTHIDAMKLVLDRGLTGDGGPPGRHLSIALAELVEKIGGAEPPAPARRGGNAPDPVPEPSQPSPDRAAGPPAGSAGAADRIPDRLIAERSVADT